MGIIMRRLCLVILFAILAGTIYVPARSISAVNTNTETDLPLSDPNLVKNAQPNDDPGLNGEYLIKLDDKLTKVLDNQNELSKNLQVEISFDASNNELLKKLDTQISAILEIQTKALEQNTRQIAPSVDSNQEEVEIKRKWWQSDYFESMSFFDIAHYFLVFCIGYLAYKIQSHTSKRIARDARDINSEIDALSDDILFQRMVVKFIYLYAFILSWGLVSQLLTMPLEQLNEHVLEGNNIAGFIIKKIHITGWMFIVIDICFPLKKEVKAYIKSLK